MRVKLLAKRYAQALFDLAVEQKILEKVHGDLYQKAIDSMKSDNDIPKKDYYVCPTCGYTVADKAPDKCPVCGAKEEMFNKA